MQSNSSQLLKLLKLNQYVPARLWSERVYYPLIQRAVVTIINVENLGLCLTLIKSKVNEVAVGINSMMFVPCLV